MEDVYKRWEVVVQAAVLRTKIAVNRVRSSTTTTTKTPAITEDELTRQTRHLVNDYVDDRLIRSGLNMKQRIVSSSSSSSLFSIREKNGARSGQRSHNTTMQTLQGILMHVYIQYIFLHTYQS